MESFFVLKQLKLLINQFADLVYISGEQCGVNHKPSYADIK